MTKQRADQGSTGHRPLRAARETNLRRRPSTREQRKTVLAVTNGTSTEHAYLEGLRQELHTSGQYRLLVAVEKGSPLDAVRGAARRRDTNDVDQAYVVCDVDEYPTAEPTREARQRGVALLWSNPCFEVWLILHHSDCTRHLENARKAEDLLGRHVKNWDKARLAFDDFRDGIPAAIERARQLGNPPDANPSTAVWQLVEALRQQAE